MEDSKSTVREEEQPEMLEVDEGPILGLERQFSTVSEDDPESEVYSAKVVIIGAGPVGLWLAIQLKLHDPYISIAVLEKHTTYQRSHVLRLSEDSYRDSVLDQRLKDMIRNWGKVVRTNVMEGDMLDYALELGVYVEQFEFTLDTNLEATFREAQVFIGADGYHSTCRQSFFREIVPSFHETIQHTLLLKYEVFGRTRPLKKLTEIYPTLKVLDQVFVTEYVGEYNELTNRTPVTLQMIICDTDFEQLHHTGMRNVMTFDDFASFPSNLQRSIKVWINVRAKQCQDTPVQCSERINCLPLHIYKSKHVAMEANLKCYFIVGDAAFAVPYFRALNNGLLCATQLAKAVYAFTNGIISCEDTCQTYSRYVDKLSSKEFKKAKSKRRSISTVNFFTSISSVVPWQINRWSGSNIKKFNLLPEFCSR
mmetsp:Transcript_25699/g.45039  ORF Transcript_25699/g.45039 Transcript_25699/m.45039 type:complete len:423 (+) Transcript_25699:1854-3122(+)